MADLARLFHHQWSLAVLADLRRGRRPGASRQALAGTLDALSQQGLVAGGALTRRGERVAARAEALLERLGAEPRRKWALPIVDALGERPLRFGELKAALPSATARALSMSLKDLIAQGLVARRVLDGFPPRAEYALTRKARALSPILRGLAGA
jgi:DNA-binding HxlR family transcriptional regulator